MQRRPSAGATCCLGEDPSFGGYLDFRKRETLKDVVGNEGELRRMTTDLGAQEPQRRLHPTAVLFDRYPLWLDGLERALTRLEVFVVGRAMVLEHALALVAAHRPDLFVFSAAGPNAGEWLQRVRAGVPELRAVVFMENGRRASADRTTAYLSQTASAD